MIYDISTSDIFNALKPAQRKTVHGWLKGLPHHRSFAGFGGGSGESMYRFTDVVTRLRERRRKGLYGDDLTAVVRLLRDQPPDLPLDDAVRRSEALQNTLRPTEMERFDRVRKWAGQGAIFEIWDRIHHVNLNRALNLLILRPVVLRYALTGERSDEFPVTRKMWGDLIAKHIAATATPSELRNLNMNITMKELKNG